MMKHIKNLSIVTLFLALTSCGVNKQVIKDLQSTDSRYKDVEFPEDDELDDLPESGDEDREKM